MNYGSPNDYFVLGIIDLCSSAIASFSTFSNHHISTSFSSGSYTSYISYISPFPPFLLCFYVVIQISVYLFLIIYVFLRYKAQEETGSAGEQPVSNKLYGCTV
jgi:hypothetical protein